MFLRYLFLSAVLLVIAASAQRQDIGDVSTGQMQQFGDAIRSGRAVQIARRHGFDLGQCPHGNLRFLTWHRAIINDLEDELGFPLPYWD